jgi:uncharacterized protein
MNGNIGSGALPFHTFLWKIASRCNLNCSYCYVYNREDQRWRDQPSFMSRDVALRVAQRMREHLESHNKRDASIVFHGGEPLLGGREHLAMLIDVIASVFDGSGISVSVGMQSNALLFNADLGHFMTNVGMSIGVSIDGPPAVNDRYRLNHSGRPTSRELERKLALLTSEFRGVFSGFLCVMDPSHSATATIRYLLDYEPPGIDFLFPLDNHDRRPPGKQEISATPYGDWLCEAFDYWFEQPNRTRIRIFTSIMRMLCGHPTQVESLGLLPVDLIVVETNGQLEAVDSLKSTFEGATSLGYAVDSHTFDQVAVDLRVRSRQLGADALSETCRRCSIVHVCGGGYVPHRYARANGFDNPSVYCADLQRIIHHIHQRLEAELREVG